MNAELGRLVRKGPGQLERREDRRRAFLGASILDELLSRGIAYSTQIMVVGDTGVGKSVLAAQFLYEGLLVGDACVYVACDEPPDNMRQNMANLRLGTIAYEREGRLAFLDAFGRDRSRERDFVADPSNLEEYFAGEKAVLERYAGRPTRLVVDSISTVVGTKPRNEVLEFNRARLRYLGARGVLTLDNYVTGLLDEQTMAGLSHSYPLIVKLGFLNGHLGVQRFVQLGKLRSGMFSGEQRLFRIDPRAGIVGQR